jgi:hypothetical protein
MTEPLDELAAARAAHGYTSGYPLPRRPYPLWNIILQGVIWIALLAVLGWIALHWVRPDLIPGVKEWAGQRIAPLRDWWDGLDYTMARPIAVWAALIVLVFVFWWWPIRVAYVRQHPSLDAIQILAALGLCVPFLWFIALIWAYAVPRQGRRRRHP